MVKKKEKMMMMVFVKFKEPKISEMSFDGNKKNKLDSKLDKTFDKQDKKRRKKK